MPSRHRSYSSRWSTARPFIFISGKETRYVFTRGLVGLEVGLGWSGKCRPPPGFEPRWGYADYATLVTRRLRLPQFLDNQHMKVVRLSALRTGRLYLPGGIHGTDFCQRPSRLQGHSATGRSKSMKKPNDSIGNRTHYLPAYSAMPQPAEPPGTSVNNNA
jgi:hypothetical protein